jgi:hypothetical protein
MPTSHERNRLLRDTRRGIVTLQGMFRSVFRLFLRVGGRLLCALRIVFRNTILVAMRRANAKTKRRTRGCFLMPELSWLFLRI